MPKKMDLATAVAMIEEMENTEDDTIDIVEIPPEKVDEQTDEEDIDEDSVQDDLTQPGEVPGKVELHSAIEPDEHLEKIPNKKRKIKVDWMKKPSYSKFHSKVLINNEELHDKDFVANKLDGKSPIAIFDELTEGLFELMAREATTYASQKNKEFRFLSEDYKAFCAILLLSGYRPVPRQHQYWSADADLRCDIVKNSMTKNRFCTLKQFLHFNNNDLISPECTDKLYKIRPLLDLCNRNFQKLGFFETSLSVDEKMVRYYGRHSIKQFLYGKPIRFGFKEWAVCGSRSGYTYRFKVYQGAEEKQDVPLGERTVLELVEGVPPGTEIYFDNFFTNLSLLAKLSDRKYAATGSLRSNRIPNDLFTPVSDFKKKDRGYAEMAIEKENNICACRWKDNNIVTCLSNCFGMDPAKVAKRRVKASNTQTVNMPHMLAKYNDGMGGVDMADWKTEKYRCAIKSKKWYFVIFTHCLDVTVVNTSILYNLGNPEAKKDLLEVRRLIATFLFGQNSSHTSKPRHKVISGKIPMEIRLSGRHFIQRTEGELS